MPDVTSFQYLDDSLQRRSGRADYQSGWFMKEENGKEHGPYQFLTYKGTDNQNWTIGFKWVNGPVSRFIELVHRLRDDNNPDNFRPTFNVWDWNHHNIAMEYHNPNNPHAPGAYTGAIIFTIK